MKNKTILSEKILTLKDSIMKEITLKHLVVIDFYELAKEHSLTIVELEDLLFEVRTGCKKQFTHCYNERSRTRIEFFSRELALLYYSLNKVQEGVIRLYSASPDIANKLMNTMSKEERQMVNRILDMTKECTLVGGGSFSNPLSFFMEGAL